MRIILLILIVLQTNLMFAQPGVAPEREIEGKRYYAHKVEAGNTLWGLQQMYGVQAEEIMKANPELSAGLKTGQTVLIPMKAAPVKEAVTSAYKVKRGETLYGLSRKFNTTVDELIRLNPILATEALQKGQAILVPGNFVDTDEDPETTEVTPEVINVPNPFVVDTVKAVNGTSHAVHVKFSDSIVEHKVLAHETMYSISKRFMVSIETIMKVNNLSSTQLSEGQILKIPLKQERIEKLIVKPVPDPNASDSNAVPVYEKKDRYKIAIIAPFFLDHGKGYSNFISEAATQFYMGAALALDTLESMGLKADVQFYDSKRDSASILQILNSPGFDQTDLIIGPFFANTQALVADFCKANQIRLMTPVAAESAILDNNPYVYAAVPSSITLMTELGKYVANNHKTDRVMLVKPAKEEDMPLYNAFRDAYNGATVKGTKAALNETTMEGMKHLMTKSGKNVFIMPTTNRYNASKLVSEVSRSDFRAAKDGIIIYGTKEWAEITDVHNAYKNKYNMRFANPTFVDYYSERMIYLNKKYRKRYNTDLPKMAVQGYDIMLFACSEFFMDQKPVNLMMNQFRMEQFSPADGFENAHIFIVEQDDFELINVELPKND